MARTQEWYNDPSGEPTPDEQVDAAALAQPTSGPEETPLPLPDAAPSTPPAPSSQIAPTFQANRPSERDLLEKAAVGRALDVGTPAPAGTLANAAPPWYSNLLAQKPATHNALPGMLMGLAGAIKRPRRPGPSVLLGQQGYKPANEGQGAQSAQMLAGIVDQVSNKGYYDQQNQLGTAMKQAQMARTLRGAGGRPGDPLGALRYMLDKDKFGYAQGKDQAKAEAFARLEDMNSPETRNARKKAVLSNVMTADEANQLSGNQINDKTYATAFRMNANRDAQGLEHDRRADRRENERVGAEERAQGYGFAKEQREQGGKDVEGYIPGYKYGSGHAGVKKVQEDARDAIAQTARITDNAAKLKSIQDELEKAHALAGATGVIDQYIGTERQQELLAQAKLAAFEISNALRSPQVANMGVPQQYELELVKNINPEAGSIKGFFKGRPSWEALQQGYSDALKTKLHTWDIYGNDEEAPSSNRPTSPTDMAREEAIPSQSRPPNRRYQPAKRGEEVDLPTSDENLGTAPVPSLPSSARQAPASSKFSGEGTYEIVSPQGQKSNRPLTQAQWEKLNGMGFPLRRVQ